MTISIVIPVYNHEKYVGACIRSAVAQTYNDFEVIVVNDGSTDGTADVCSGFGDEIRYFEKSNGGPASALNVGVANMKGAWFKWLSSDDMLRPRSLETLMAKAQETGGSVVYGDWEIINEEGAVTGIFREKSFDFHEDFCIALFNGFIGNASATLIRKSCFNRTGLFDTSLRLGEDYLMWFKLAKHYRFIHTPVVVAAYRYHPRRLTDAYYDFIPYNDAQIRKIAWAYWKAPHPGRCN